jgi:hypothetical protein
VQQRGFLMVKLWWIDGGRWSKGGVKRAVKNAPHFLDLFLVFPVLGNRTYRQLLFRKGLF